MQNLLTYGTDAATSHFTNTYRYLQTGDMQPCEPTAETHTATTNEVFIARWTRLSGSRDVELFVRLQSVLSNLPLFMLPGVKLQIKLTKARPSYYPLNKTADSKTIFKLLDAYLLVRRLHPNPAISLAQTMALRKI